MSKSSKSRAGRKAIKDRAKVRTSIISVRFTPKEAELVRKAAKVYDYTTGEFCANVILAMTNKALTKDK